MAADENGKNQNDRPEKQFQTIWFRKKIAATDKEIDYCKSVF